MTMTEELLYKHASRFRNAIVTAKNKGLFENDANLSRFPRCSCRDVSYRFANYLYQMGIHTIIVFTDDGNCGSHAWLIIKDYRVNAPQNRHFEYPEYLKETIA